MVDTGAYENFIDCAAAHRAGCSVQKDHSLGEVRCAGDQVIPILGRTRCQLRIGSYTAVVQFLVVERLLSETGVILGQPWLTDNNVLINGKKKTCSIRRYGTRCEIHPLAESDDDERLDQTGRVIAAMASSSLPTTCTVASPKQAAKLLKCKGTNYLMVNVRASQGDSTPQPRRATSLEAVQAMPAPAPGNTRYGENPAQLPTQTDAMDACRSGPSRNGREQQPALTTGVGIPGGPSHRIIQMVPERNRAPGTDHPPCVSRFQSATLMAMDGRKEKEKERKERSPMPSDKT